MKPDTNRSSEMTRRLPAQITVEMSLFPNWAWQVNDAATGMLYRRFRTDADFRAFMAKHYA